MSDWLIANPLSLSALDSGSSGGLLLLDVKLATCHVSPHCPRESISPSLPVLGNSFPPLRGVRAVVGGGPVARKGVGNLTKCAGVVADRWQTGLVTGGCGGAQVDGEGEKVFWLGLSSRHACMMYLEGVDSGHS